MCCAQAGYAVIFLSRKSAVQPFERLLPHGDAVSIVDQLVLSTPSGDGGTGLAFAGRYVQDVAKLKAELDAVHAQGTLLRVGYETVFEYLQVRHGAQGPPGEPARHPNHPVGSLQGGIPGAGGHSAPCIIIMQFRCRWSGAVAY